MKNNRSSVLSATSLIGEAVRTPEGEHLGKIKDVMIDLNTGNVAYVVLSVLLGFQEKLFALPWAVLVIDMEYRCMLLNVEKGWFEEAAGFDEDNWPQIADRRFLHALSRSRDGSLARDEHAPIGVTTHTAF